MLLYEGQVKIKHHVSPANWQADREAEPDTRILPALLYQLQAGQLGQIVIISRVYVQQCHVGFNRKKPILYYIYL